MGSVTADPRAGFCLGGCGPAAEWSEPVAAASRLQKVRRAGRAGFPVLANCDRAKSPANRLPAATSICAPAARPSHPCFPRTQPSLGRPCRPLSPAPPPGSCRPGSRSHRRRTTLTISCLRRWSLVSSLSRVLLGWLGWGEPEVGEDEEEDGEERGKLQQLLLLLQPLPPPPLPPPGSRPLSGGTGSSPRSERRRLSGTLRPSFSSMSLRSGSGPSSMTFQER